MDFGFAYTYSAEHLQSLPEKHRKDVIRDAVDHLYRPVLVAATAGKTSYLINVGDYLKKIKNGCQTYPPPYIVTIDDLLEGFRDKFPGCKVEYTETWEDVRPGVREQRSGILIDWSPPRRNSVTLKF
jgi:hypothetical protein